MIHPEPHPQAGQAVMVDEYTLAVVVDWWDRYYGSSWKSCMGESPICAWYALQIEASSCEPEPIPPDDEVVVLKIGPSFLMLHQTELNRPPFATAWCLQCGELVSASRGTTKEELREGHEILFGHRTYKDEADAKMYCNCN